VQLSGPASRTVTVYASTADGTATAGFDYLPVANAPIIFPAGTTNQTFVVQVVGDLLDEPDETFFVNLTTLLRPTSASAKPKASAPSWMTTRLGISISDVTVADNPSGTTNAVFILSLSRRLPPRR